MTLEEKIKASGLLKTHIAKKLGLSPQYFSMMINDNATMPEEIRNKLNELLDKVLEAA